MEKKLINPQYKPLESFIDESIRTFETSGEHVYGGRRNLIKRFVAPDGTRLIIKRYKKPAPINDIIYSTGLRLPKGLRAYRYAYRLLQAGISTPEPVAYIERRRCGLLRYSFFASVECPLPHLMYEAGDIADSCGEPLAKALGAFAADMHNAGILHLDFSPGNILWDCSNGEYHFAIVDINRMRFGKVSLRQGCRSFRRLWGSRRFFTILAHTYAVCRGLDPQECERATLQCRSRFWNNNKRLGKIEYQYVE